MNWYLDLFYVFFIASIKVCFFYLIIFIFKKVFKYKAIPHNLILFTVITKLIIPIPIGFNIESWDVFSHIENQSQEILTKSLSGPAYHDDISNKKRISIYENKYIWSSVYHGICLIWILGIVVYFLYYLKKLKQQQIFIRSCQTCLEPHVNRLIKKCLSETGFKRKIKLLISSETRQPILLGVFKPRIILPSDKLWEYNSENLRHIFLHEIGHCKQQDIFKIHLLSILKCIYWFNPLLGLIINDLVIDFEICSDNYALRILGAGQKHLYGKTLINLLSMVSKKKNLSLTTGLSDNKKNIKRRINMIAVFKPHTKLKYFMGIIFLFVCSLIFVEANDAANPLKITGSVKETQLPVLWPVNSSNYRITSKYGMRVDPNSGKTVFHHGLDIACKIGTEIVSSADGTVVDTGYHNIAGNYVVIQHANNLQTIYTKLNQVKVKKNDVLKQGSLVGFSGNTGRSTGPHLHFAVKIGEKSIDPLSFLKENKNFRFNHSKEDNFI